jgi:HSP20 family protein
LEVIIMRVLEELKQGLEEAWETVAEGWQRLRQQAAGAVTRFKSGEHDNLPAEGRVDPSQRFGGWAVLAGDIYEDNDKILVRLEVPGLNKDDLHIEVRDDVLTVGGEKRFQHEETQGHYRLLQCAYGAFSRQLRLPARVRAGGEAKATYRDGVLRIELQKDMDAHARTIDIPVS